VTFTLESGTQMLTLMWRRSFHKIL